MENELRKFGFILTTGLFTLFLVFPFMLHRQLTHWPLIVCPVIVGLSILKPRWLTLLYHLWMKLGHLLGWINTRLILGIVFFALITPIGLLRRHFSSDPLMRSYDKNAVSYRQKSTPHTAKQMEKPF